MMKNVYSVGQVNTYIKNMFAQDFMMQRISVKGEVSNCKYHSSGHIYFTLKDPAGTINAIMFAGNRRGLSFQMKEGDKVIVTGSVEVYERDGKYQLYAREIELDGAGNLYLKFEALKKELEEMGMFAPEYKKRIPTYIRRLGIVTAPTGAAVQDIRNISARRNPYVQLILYPALVQGEGAVSSIINGIRALDALGVDVNMEVIVSILMGGIFILLGNYMSKNHQNYTVGIKLPWTLNSEENWNRTHRMAGKLWILAGLVFWGSVFFENNTVPIVIIVVVVTIPMIYSFVLYKKGI